MRQAMKAEAPQVPAAPPLDGQRVGSRRVRDGGVERGIEAGHSGHMGKHLAHRLKASQRLGLVQRGEVGQRFQPADDAGVHEHGGSELGPAMDYAVAHRVDGAVAGHDLLESGLVHLAPGGRQDF